MTRKAPEAVPPRRRARDMPTAGALLILGFAVYGNALRNPFNIDDTEVILNDVRVYDCRLGELLSGPYWPPAFRDALYRPLVKISFALNWAVSREPWTFRLPNLLLHVGSAYLVFLLTADLARSYWAGAAAAVIFTVHPIHTEVLNAIVGRTDLAAAFFGLLAVWLFWRDGAEAGWRNGWRPITATVALSAALLCKESALPLVGVVALLDGVRARMREGGPGIAWLLRRGLRCYVPVLLVVVGYMVARQKALGEILKDPSKFTVVDNVIAHPEHGLGPGDSLWLARWGTPAATFGLAAKLMVWPHPLAWDYSYATIESVKRWSDRRLLLGLLTLGAMLAAMAVSFRRRRLVLAALGFALMTYALVSNVFVVIGTVFAERLLYLPSVGFCMLAGFVAGSASVGRFRTPHGSGGLGARNGRPRTSVRGSDQISGAASALEDASVPVRRKVGAIALLGIFVVGGGWYGFLTLMRNRDWNSRAALDAADVKTHPRSCKLLAEMGRLALERREPDVALEFARQALAVHPGFASAWRVSGLARWQQDDKDAALLDLKRSFELGGGNDEQANVIVTEALASRGDYVQAIGLLRRLVETNPLAATAQNNLAWYLITAEPAHLRDPQAALIHAEQAVRLRPDEPEFLDTYVSVLLALGRKDEAARALREGLPSIPDSEPRRVDLVKRLNELE